MTQLGINKLLTHQFHILKNRRIGLITNHTGVNEDLESTIDLLANYNDIELVALFGPEHGVRGGAQAGDKVDDDVDPATGVPIHSLYGGNLAPTGSQLEGIDLLICDLQDIGCRFWTYANTMAYSMAVAGKQGIDFVVIDRPNPIGGTKVEGNLVAPGFFSFIGGYPLPIRHGFTMGELAQYLNTTESMGAQLSVVTMEGWNRSSYYEDTGLAWVPPSPNMPTVDTAVIYPGTCFFEGTNLSEGRGTTKPFEWIGAPWIDGAAWAKTLNSLNLPGARFRPVYFTPTFHKHAGQLCQGVQVHVTSRHDLLPVQVGLFMLHTARSQNPDMFGWREARKDNCLPFDLLAGTNNLRAALENEVHPMDILDGWKEELANFLDARQNFLIYAA